MDNLPNCRIERTGLRVRWIYVVHFQPKSLVQAMLEKIKGGISKLLITFQTLDRLVVDAREVQNCRPEDDFASKISLRAFSLHRLKMLMSCKSQVRSIQLKACFFVFPAMSYCLFHHRTAILIDLLD